MTIRKTKSGSYHVEVFFPKNVRQILSNGDTRFRKTVKTKAEAERLQRATLDKISNVVESGTYRAMSTRGDMLFKDFYQEVWWDIYVNGGSSRVHILPSKATVAATKSIFRLHLLPLFGKYTLNELNNDPEIVRKELMILSETYANIKTVKSYVHQMFAVAEAAGYLELNHIDRVLNLIGSPKKNRLRVQRQAAGEALTADELLAWLDAAKDDLAHEKITEQDYLLFVLTLNLGDRKSETYALQWKHVDLQNGYLYLLAALGKDKTLGPTKGRKQTKVQLPDFLCKMLKSWKKHQVNNLAVQGITDVTPEQFVFTYTDFKGHMNQPLHPDFLNYRLNSIAKRHPNLAPLHPHKLRHTFSTLAAEGGASITTISAALTHSDTSTTQIYVNAPATVGLAANDAFAKKMALARANSENRDSQLF